LPNSQGNVGVDVSEQIVVVAQKIGGHLVAKGLNLVLEL
jgi:hypothetical protein